MELTNDGLDVLGASLQLESELVIESNLIFDTGPHAENLARLGDRVRGKLTAGNEALDEPVAEDHVLSALGTEGGFLDLLRVGGGGRVVVVVLDRSRHVVVVLVLVLVKFVKT